MLTFDDGPTPELTPYILDLLNKHNVKAIFVLENVLKYPDLYQRIINEGHIVGNHTMNHLDAYSVSFNNYIDNIDKAREVINSNLFRPPYVNYLF